MSTDNQQSKAEVLRPDAVAPVDEPEQRLLSGDEDQTSADSDASSTSASPYPDGPGSNASPYPDGPGAGAAHIDGWGPGAAQYAGVAQGGRGAPVAPYLGDAYPPSVAQFDPGADFEPPDDLPPWYEDEYYDDRDWEQLPRRTSTLFRVVLFVACFGVVVLVSGLFVKGWVDDQLDPPGGEGDLVAIEIPQGASTNDIVRILGDEGVVANSTVFRYYLRVKDASEFQAGSYTFNANMAVWDVMDTLESGAVLQVVSTTSVTVPEGFRLSEIQTSLLTQLPRFDATELGDALATVRKPAVFSDQVLFATEGILFPDTYDVGEDNLDNEAALLERMVTRFDQIAAEVGLAEGAERLGITPYQVLIIASLIEEEARADVDRAKIARVIYNRLEIGEPLGIDATIVYALGGDRELSAADLQVDSQYNTRIYAGLPPTPIASPGRKSLEAALNPEDGDWLFYVLTEEDGPGTHTFTTNLEDHNAAVQICIERGLGCG